ncbi:ABC transporter permease [Candidatus Methanoperedens nitratireducens]|uniref:Binding-protein-dependent transport system inner membrane protein n=1 Tax=Candidatus Methanoperedens nitratireducens TaxID=1392998 RepID=A0A284VQR7_9EURY
MIIAGNHRDKLKNNKPAMLGLVFVILLFATAILGPFVTSNPNEINFNDKNLPPLGFSIEQSVYNIKTQELETTGRQGNWEHPLGTDDKGRDMLAMLVSGARVSLEVGFLATGIAILIGTLIGVISAYFGGWLDNVLMRFTDVIMTFPFFLLLVLIVYMYGASIVFIILAIGLTGWTGAARLVRSEVLSLRTLDFITASKALGASDLRVILHHLIPNTLSSIIVIATLSIPGVILAEAALSFIGLGDPGVTSWGRVLNAGQDSLVTTWWVAVEPGILLFLTVLAFNFLGDGLRDALDPKSE